MLFFRKRLKYDKEETDRKQKEIAGEFEKGDIPAIVIAALFGLLPALLVPIALLVVVYFIFVH